MKLAHSGRNTGTTWVADAVGINPYRLLRTNAFNWFFVCKAVVGRRHPKLRKWWKVSWKNNRRSSEARCWWRVSDCGLLWFIRILARVLLLWQPHKTGNLTTSRKSYKLHVLAWRAISSYTTQSFHSKQSTPGITYAYQLSKSCFQTYFPTSNVLKMLRRRSLPISSVLNLLLVARAFTFYFKSAFYPKLHWHA